MLKRNNNNKKKTKANQQQIYLFFFYYLVCNTCFNFINKYCYEQFFLLSLSKIGIKNSIATKQYLNKAV